MSEMCPIVLKKSFWGDDRNFSGPLMRFARGDMRDHVVSHKNDQGASYRRCGVLQWRGWQIINFARFSVSFNFRLLQHYRLLPDVSVLANVRFALPDIGRISVFGPEPTSPYSQQDQKRARLWRHAVALRLHQALEPATDHPLAVERHRFSDHHGFETRICHHLGVDPVALGARLVGDPGEHHGLTKGKPDSK